MTGMRHVVRLAIGLVIGLTAGTGGIALASQQRPYRLNDQQLQDLGDGHVQADRLLHSR